MADNTRSHTDANGKRIDRVFDSTEKPTLGKFKEYTGLVKGKLRVIGYAGRNKNGHYWDCSCDCGKELSVSAQALLSDKKDSCGCTTRAKIIAAATKHGRTSTTEWSIWHGIRKRCLCVTDQVYHRYGGRGIGLCQEWTDSFESFLRDMGPRPSMQHTVDRIDNDKGYSPENCRWALWKQQQRNRRTNHIWEYNGKRLCITEWAELTGVRKDTLRRRVVVYKWSIERALTTPLNG